MFQKSIVCVFQSMILCVGWGTFWQFNLACTVLYRADDQDIDPLDSWSNI